MKDLQGIQPKFSKKSQLPCVMTVYAYEYTHHELKLYSLCFYDKSMIDENYLLETDEALITCNISNFTPKLILGMCETFHSQV